MRCQEVHEWMSLDLDGRLPAGDKRRMEAHMALCPACAEQWLQWRDIASLFEGAPMVQPPVDLTAGVLARIQPKPRWNHREAGSALLISMAVMVAGLALLTALLLGPAIGACGSALRAAQTPGMLGVAASVLADLLEFTAMLAQAGHILLRAVLTPRSAALAMAYGAIFLASLVGWLRLVVFKPMAMES